MAPCWQWRNLPSHARSLWTGALHEDLATRDNYNRLAMGPEWVKRQGYSHLFGIQAITRSSFLGKDRIIEKFGGMVGDHGHGGRNMRM